MNVLLIYIPSRKQAVEIPYGLLYVASSILEEGHDVKIVDLSLGDLSHEELISEIEKYEPSVIGFGAITSGYRNLKDLSLKIKGQFPNIPLIAGGVIASVSELLIKRAKIDAVVLREGERVIKNILRVITESSSFSHINGLAYRGENGSYNENPAEKQIINMDSIPIPRYSLIDVTRYCMSVDDYMNCYNFEGILDQAEIERIKSRGKYLISIISSRGCTNKCSFCYRHMKGIRQFSPKYVVNQIKYLQREYDIHFFQFVDELTNVSKKWCHEFCDILEYENVDITYVINGARASNVDEHLLRRFKKTGCIKIGFGYETGSQKTLDYIGKGVSKETNYEVGMFMKKVGLHDSPQIVIGFPPDSPITIKETIDFLKSLVPISASINYILPFPKTKDWEYCLKEGLIKDEEEFILDYDEAANFRINLTKYPDEIVRKWQRDITIAVKLHDLKGSGKYVKYIIYSVLVRVNYLIKPYVESYRCKFSISSCKK